MRTNTLFLALVGLLFIVPSVAHAKDVIDGARYTLSLTKPSIPSAWTQDVGYTARVKGKLLFGIKNALLGVAELYNEPREAKRDGRKLIVGIGHGLRNMVGDTVGGALHLLTFPITAVDVTLPEGGTDVL